MIALAVTACESTTPRPTLVFEVIASHQAFDAFEVNVIPLEAEPNLEFRSPFLAKRFTSHDRLDAVEMTSLSIISTANGQEKNRLMWKPWVCGLDPEMADKIARGWSGQETLQVFLQDDGILSIESDFGRPLTHNCDWYYSPSGDSGEGFGTVNRSTTLCTEIDRSATDLKLEDVTDEANPIEMPFTLCQAYDNRPNQKDPQFAGSIANQFVVDRGGPSILGLALTHCWSEGETYPVTVTPESWRSDACGGAAIDDRTSPDVGGVEAAAVTGQWVLSNGPELPGGGHQLSEMDLTFASATTPERRYRAHGHVDVPIVKLNIVRLR